ncbi:5-oxoprolinase subunit C family protein [Pedobacter nutrimenti]|jgi:antagonist of KipI|uniref:Antagonist of KipI n=1 Tax=Pedobacter nutrimenti TaxID=1241337 RepID=A0A318UC41_9SPHI|nr:biotin-dependent carboxyltransferase family protein [Pedobacter nutrimenti]PYF74002.1 antagonist of KipI [Pedobacter nutrimenti]
MGIRVIKPGLLSSIQDLGRYGYQKSGMAVSGAMDGLALQIGNLLLGNAKETAGLECTLLGPVLVFEKDQLIALTGGDLSAQIDGLAVPMWKPLYVHRGAVLSFGKAVKGCRTYLCVYGGFNLPEVLSSASTYLKAGIGGWKGRALKRDDLIPFKRLYTKSLKKFNWSSVPGIYPDLQSNRIRVLEGPEFKSFTRKSRSDFFEQSFSLSTQADRMGHYLDGPLLYRDQNGELLSAAVSFGTVQVPPQGKPIVLMADHQTTGGYPRIAQVITADLTCMAQMQAGHQIRFEGIGLAQAQELLVKRKQQLEELQKAITLKYG